jgi:outer membrane immunogenic protein
MLGDSAPYPAIRPLMKRLFVGIVFILGGLAAATAADLDTATLSPALDSPTYNWTGFYFGGDLGRASGRSDLRTTAALAGPGSYFQITTIPVVGAVGARNIKPSGATVGMAGGYDWQTGNLVLGLETDFSYLNLHGSTTGGAIYPCCAPTGFLINSSVRSDWLLTARPRIGVAHDGLLLFVTGGLALSKLNSGFAFSDNNSAATASGSVSNTAAGYAFGGGVEARASSHWTVKAEYLHVDLGRISAASSNLTSSYGPSPLNVFMHSADLQVNLVRVGVHYRF